MLRNYYNEMKNNMEHAITWLDEAPTYHNYYAYFNGLVMSRSLLSTLLEKQINIFKSARQIQIVCYLNMQRMTRERSFDLQKCSILKLETSNILSYTGDGKEFPTLF